MVTIRACLCARHIVNPALDVDQTGMRGYKTRVNDIQNN